MNRKKNQYELDFGNNSFDYFRMFSAVMIIIGHCVTHLKINIPFIGKIFIGSWIGLVCLFTLTGYLIPASLERSSSNYEFLKRRALRLYPGLWTAFLISFLCVVFIGGAYGLKYNILDIILWALGQLTAFQFYTPEPISMYGVGNPNGALWTISMEIQIYIVIMSIWKWLKKQKAFMWMILIFSSIIVNITFPLLEKIVPLIVYKLLNVTFIPYMYIFLIGMFCFAKRNQILPYLVKWFWAIVMMYTGWFLANSLIFQLELGHYTNIITGLLTCLITISGGYKAGQHRIKNEISYGLYIYHMIIINAFVMFGFIGKLHYILIVVMVTWIIALLSNNLIEKPIIKRFK